MPVPTISDEEYRRLKPDLEIRDSKIAGKGIFAKTPLKAGEVVLAWNPKVLTVEEAARLPDEERKHYTYPEGKHVLWMQPPERFVNHSCEPNTYVVGRSDVALRNIKAGEEITSDYMDLETENFICNCGSIGCRGRRKDKSDEI